MALGMIGLRRLLTHGEASSPGGDPGGFIPVVRVYVHRDSCDNVVLVLGGPQANFVRGLVVISGVVPS